MNRFYDFFGKWGDKQKSLLFHSFLRDEVLATLCQKIPLAMAINIVVAGAIVYILYPLFNNSSLFLWYLAVLTLSFYRGFSARKKCREDNTSLEIRYRQFRVEALAMAFLWTILPLFFFPSYNLTAQLVMLVLLLGIAAAGALNLIIDPKVSDIYITSILGAFTIRFFAFDTLHLELTVLLILFIITLIFSTRQLHRIVIKGTTQHRRVDELQNRLDQIFEQAPVGILYFNTRYEIIDTNRAMTKIFGIPKETIRRINLLHLKDKRAVKDLTKVLTEGIIIHYEGPYVTTSTEEEVWISVIFSPIRNSDGLIVGGMAVIQDKTAEHEALTHVEFLAHHDPLTALPNRKLLEDRYRLQITQAAREGYYSAMLFLDLDRFKHINDTYGHGIGDDILKETAKRLQKILRQSDTICRLGGDEFIIFLPMISKDADHTLNRIWHITEKIHRSLENPYDIQGHTLYVTTSIGAILIHGDREPLNEILRKIDIAMYHAKQQGKGVTSFYEQEMDHRLRRSIELEEALRYAIERDELYLEFQPIVDARKNSPYGAEALLRWRMSNGISVSPVEFIPVAEESGLIHPIGMWVIEKSCEAIRELKKENRFPLQYISINISSKQFGNRHFFNEVMEIIQRYEISSDMIKFEITESILMEDPHSAREVIHRFNKAGIAFLIDDFGTGYSSLSYLKTFRFDTIKIDRSFIRDILSDPDDVTLVKAILDIAHQFDNRVIAEGVESKDQIEVLEMLEPQILCQGFYYTPPLPLDRFKEWIATRL